MLAVSPLELLAVLVLGVIVLTPVAERLALPQPVLVTLFGAGVGLLPATPHINLPPQLILPAVLPPLLFAATLRTTPQDFREQVTPVLLMAVGLTIVTAASVAAVAHLAGLPWAVAWVLGAGVSPPDPVAATSISRRLGLPTKLVTVLEGEGLFNDATALVLFQVAVAAVVAGTVNLATIPLTLLLSVAGGLLLGLALGLLTRWALLLLTDAPTETTVTLALPYAAYLLAERLHVSGVLAVLATGLYLRSGAAHRALTSRGWLEGRTVWRYTDFVITSGAFLLLGLELAQVLRASGGHRPSWTLVGVVLGAVILLRALWVFPVAWVLGRRRAEDDHYGWRESSVVAWCGIRGVVTVATALALPAATKHGDAFPHRADVILVALAVVAVTLIAQGLTLGPLVRWLDVSSDEDRGIEVEQLRRRAARAAHDRLRDLRRTTREPEALDAVREGYEDAYRSRQAFRHAGSAAPDTVREALEEALDAERQLVLEARHGGQTSTEAADLVLTEIESRALRSTQTETARDVPEAGDA